MALVCLGLALLTLAAFWGLWRNEFVNYDDMKYIAENYHVTTGFRSDNLAWAFNAGYMGNWHPLTWMSHMLDCVIFGVNPAGHHAMNLVLHTLNTVLLFLVLFRMTRARWQSAFVAALFAVHPLHVQSVAWAAERKDVLSTFFWMLAIGAYALYTERPNWVRYSLVAMLYALGLMSKPMVVTLPLVLLVLDFWPLSRLQTADNRQQTGLGKLIVEKTPLFVLALGSSVMTYIAQQRGEAVSSLELIPAGVRIENALVSYAAYLVKMLWPSRLAVLYPHPMQLLPVWQVIGAVVMLAGITVAAIRTRKSHPSLLVGWLWYLITLVPVIGIVQVGSQAIADRYTYVPLVGVFVMITWGIPGLLGKGEKEKGRKGDPSPINHQPSAINHLPLVVVACMTVAVLAVVAHGQIRYWRNNLSLFGHAVECTKNNYVMHNSYGLALEDAGRTDEAIAQYDAALRIRPEYISARLDKGIALAGQGRYQEAVAEFEQAIQSNPKFADSYYNLGCALEDMKDIPRAAEQYARAIQLSPHHVKAHTNLGRILLAAGRTDEAIDHFQDVLQTDPYSIEARLNLAAGLYNKHDLAGAEREYREVLRLKPDSGDAHSNLAIVLFLRGDYAGSWAEVRLAESYGSSPSPAFMAALSRKMPEGNQSGPAKVY